MTLLVAFLIATNIEALGALLWAFTTSSESGQALFLWLSPERVALVAVLFILWVGLLVLTVQLARSRDRTEQLLLDLDTLLIGGRRLAPAIIYFVILPLTVVIPAAIVLRIPLSFEAYRRFAPDTFPLLHALVAAGLPLLAFLSLASLECAIFLAVRYRRSLFASSLWSRDTLGVPLVVFLIALVTAFHWSVLIFQLRFFTNIPAWYWVFDPVRFGRGDLWYALGALLWLGLAYWALFVRQRVLIGLALVMCLGWFLQMGVGLMGGAGLAGLRERYFTTYHQAYVVKAAESSQTVLESIRHYDLLYDSNTFTSTKPPGLMALYIGLEHLTNGYPSSLQAAARYTRFSNLITWLFPVLATGMVLLLWAFARSHMEDPDGLVARLAPLLYVLAPSVVLFTFFTDQVLYPVLFLAGTWFAVSLIRRATFAWGLLLGAGLYAAAFFAFSMLPLYPFAGLYLLLHHWKSPQPGRLRRLALTGLGIAAGTLMMYALGMAFFNYDFLSHFLRMTTINHNFDFYLRVGQQIPTGPESPVVRLAQIARAAWLNNLDFGAAIGFPLYILFIIQAARRLLRLGQSNTPKGDIVLLALLCSFLVLNLAGTAQGEVPRLWLFWMPMVVLLAGFELEPHIRKHPQWLLLLAGVQLITIVLTFHFQDLRM